MLSRDLTARPYDGSSVRAPLYHANLWQYLASHPDEANKIKSLEIKRVTKLFNHPPPPSILPKISGLDTFDEEKDAPPSNEEGEVERENSDRKEQRLELYRRSEKLLIEALAVMPNLTDFKWDSDPPLFDARLANPANIKGCTSVWNALAENCKNLDALRVIDLAPYRRAEMQGSLVWDHVLPIHEGELFDQDIQRLQSFEYGCYSYNKEPEPYSEIADEPQLDRLRQFIQRNSATLQDLTICFFMEGPRRAPGDNSYEMDGATAQSAEVDGNALFHGLRLPSLVRLTVCRLAVDRRMAEEFLLGLPASAQSVQELGPFGVTYSPLKGFGEGLQDLIARLKKDGKLANLQ